MEALLNRAELLLLKCRKGLYFGKLDELRKKCVKEQDDVLRMEGNLFAKLRRDYEERLEEEKKESFCASLELEQAEKELTEIEEKIALFEGVSSIYNADDLNDAEREMHELDFKNLWGGWAVGDSLERKLKEIEQLRRLFYGIAEESIIQGETMLRKVKMSRFQPVERDIFGFEKKG